MKRMIAIVLVILTMTAVLAGCSGRGNSTANNNTTGPAANDNNMNSNGTNGVSGTPNTGSGTPSSSENGVIEDTNPTNRKNNIIEEFGNDMQDMVDDAGRAVQDAVDGNHARNGTGMAGGR